MTERSDSNDQNDRNMLQESKKRTELECCGCPDLNRY